MYATQQYAYNGIEYRLMDKNHYETLSTNACQEEKKSTCLQSLVDVGVCGFGGGDCTVADRREPTFGRRHRLMPNGLSGTANESVFVENVERLSLLVSLAFLYRRTQQKKSFEFSPKGKRAKIVSKNRNDCEINYHQIQSSNHN